MRLAPASLSLVLCACSPAPTGNRSLPIVGGEPTTSFPEVVAIYSDGQFACSGVLVGTSRVMTVAHCLYGLPPDGDMVTVHVGADADAPEDEVAAIALWAHPLFGTLLTHDIGMVDLERTVAVPPVPWNVEPIGAERIGQDVTLVGFGRTGASDESGLHVRRVATVAMSDLNDSAIRWQDDEAGICDGDSGGPALMDLGGGPVLVGVASEGDPGCAEWGAATRTDAFADWLEDPEQGGDDDDFTQPAPGDDDGDEGCGRGTATALLALLVPAAWMGRRVAAG